MQTWIALFRGINVGGNNILPMAELKKHLAELGCENVRTYIQSGNVVFDADGSAAALHDKIAGKIEAEHGFRPYVLLLGSAELQAAIDANPYADATDAPKTLHFLFLAEPAANANLTAIEDLKSPSESFMLIDRVFYLHAPDGIGRSKLVAKVERLLGVPATGRNYRTVSKVADLCEGR